LIEFLSPLDLGLGAISAGLGVWVWALGTRLVVLQWRINKKPRLGIAPGRGKFRLRRAS
jgi:hypothetical protein